MPSHEFDCIPSRFGAPLGSDERVRRRSDYSEKALTFVMNIGSSCCDRTDGAADLATSSPRPHTRCVSPVFATRHHPLHSPSMGTRAVRYTARACCTNASGSRKSRGSPRSEARSAHVPKTGYFVLFRLRCVFSVGVRLSYVLSQPACVPAEG